MYVCESRTAITSMAAVYRRWKQDVAVEGEDARSVLQEEPEAQREEQEGYNSLLPAAAAATAYRLGHASISVGCSVQRPSSELEACCKTGGGRATRQRRARPLRHRARASADIHTRTFGNFRRP